MTEKGADTAGAKSGIVRAILLCLTGTAIWTVAAATVTAFLRGGINAGLPPLEVFWNAIPRSLAAIPNLALLVVLVAGIQAATYAAVRRNREVAFLAVILMLSIGGAIVANLFIMQ